MNRLEALADAIARDSGWHDPQSEAYRTRNPGLLPAISPRHPRNERGLRIFDSGLSGYQALLFDLRVKCSGQSRANLAKDATLLDLMAVLNRPRGSALVVAKFLRHALGNAEIKPETPLSWFME
jgi:hypothetical protein